MAHARLQSGATTPRSAGSLGRCCLAEQANQTAPGGTCGMPHESLHKMAVARHAAQRSGTTAIGSWRSVKVGGVRNAARLPHTEPARRPHLRTRLSCGPTT
eukprot:3742941-Prymnesium_polylepis.1